MTLADLEKFVTGPAVYKSVDGAMHSTPLMGQKRKPDGYIQNEEHHNTSLHLYHLTLSKLLSSPPRRIEPSLQRSVVMRNTLKELEYRVFSHTPSKRINLDMDHDLEMADDDNNEPITASDLQVDTESCGQEPVTQYTELVTASCPSLPSSECENDTDSNKGFSSHLYFSFPALPIITNTNSSKEAHCSDDDDDCFRMESSEDSEDSSSDNSEESMDITSPTQIEESSKLSSFGSYQSLVHCSMDQYRSPSTAPSVQKSQHVDELDNIMQVLVTM